jgi:ceramide glucosyltransferase
MSLPAVLALFGLVLLVAIAVAHLRLKEAIARPPAGPPSLARYPSLSVVRPIRGLDVGARGNLRAALKSDYPGEVETLFVLDDPADPSRPLVEEMVRAENRAGGRCQLLYAGAPPPGRTGKLNAMIVGAARAQGELLAFGDSDTRPAPELLRLLVEALLADPRIGDTFAPVVVNAKAETAGDVGYALLVNGWYGPSVARAAMPRGELPFIMGQLMVFRREALAAAGGLECADGQLVDDMYLGACVQRAGYRNVMIPHPLAVTTGGMALGAFLKLFRRWLLFSQSGLPGGFTGRNWLRGIALGAALVVLIAALRIDPRVALPAAIALALALYSPVALHRRFGGAPIPLHLLWVPIALPLGGPLLVLWSLARRRVDWRGRDYALDLHARLRPT